MPRNRANTNRSQPARQPRESASNPANEPEWREMSENEREIEKSNLTFRQQSALPVIAVSPTIIQAARASGIGESTLRRWLEDDHFRDELTRLRQASANLARQELQGLMLRSVSVLTEAMDDPDMAIRLRAARYSLSFGLSLSKFVKPRSSGRISKPSKMPSRSGRPTTPSNRPREVNPSQ